MVIFEPCDEAVVRAQAKHVLAQRPLGQQLHSDGRLQREGVSKADVEQWIAQRETERQQIVTEYFTLLLGESEASVSHWATVLLPAVRSAYGFDVERCEVRRHALACALQLACGDFVLAEERGYDMLLQVTGVDLRAKHRPCRDNLVRWAHNEVFQDFL